MRFLSLFAFLIWLQPVMTSAGAEPDLPPQGRSYFDHLVHRMGGIRFPPDEIWKSSAYQDLLPGKRILTSRFADSRSLHKFSVSDRGVRELFAFVNRGTPYSMMAPDKNLGVFPSHEGAYQGVPDHGIMIGYSPEAKSLEVISYNPTMGRYEFQVVKNYGPGLKPEIHYMPRDLCISCHQHGIPIFPGGPWGESVKTQQERHRFHGSLATVGNRTGIPADEFGFDTLVRRTESVAMAQSYWREVCGSKPKTAVECRRLMLKNVLAYIGDYPYDLLKEERERNKSQLETILKNSWPKEGLLKASSFIEDRAGFANGQEMEMLSLDELGAKFDPLSPMPNASRMTRPGLHNVEGAFLDFGGPHVKEVARGDLQKIFKALDSKKMDPILNSDVLNFPDLYRVLLGELGKKVPSSSVFAAAEKKMAKPTLDLPDLPKNAKVDRRLDPLKKYCMRCHIAGEPPFAFMRGTDAQIVKFIQDPEIQARIQYRLQAYSKHDMMPPITSDLGKQFLIDKKAYKQILATVKEIGAAACGTAYKKIKTPKK